MSSLPGYRLEQYTLRRPQEVLLVQAVIDGEPDLVMIFKGFSSSLMRSTHPDPDVPILPETAEIQTIDRARSPYQPEQPSYLAQGLTWSEMEQLLKQVGV